MDSDPHFGLTDRQKDTHGKFVLFLYQLDTLSFHKKVQLDATVCRHLFTAQSLIRPWWKEVAVPVS